MLIQKHHFELLADYHQVYLQDETSSAELADSWTVESLDRMLTAVPGAIGVGTVRNMEVPLDVEVHDVEPTEEIDAWDQVNECSLEVKSGRIVVAGCSDYFPDAARIQVTPGVYRVWVFYGKLGSVSQDGLAGEDHYRVVLFPGTATDVIVHKQRAIGGKG